MNTEIMCHQDTKNRVMCIVFNKQKTKFLIVKEKITLSRMKEWLNWDDFKGYKDILNFFKSFSTKKIKQLSIPLHISREWIRKKENDTLTIRDLKRWFKDEYMFLSDRLFEKFGKWGFPKGHVYKNELFIDAIQRELKEEIGLNINKSDLYFVEKDYKANMDIYMTTIDPTQHKIQCGDEIEQYRWVDTMDLFRYRNKKLVNLSVLVYLRNNKLVSCV